MTERWSYICVVPPFFIEGGFARGVPFSDRSDKSDESDTPIDK
ncbi:hypothetical protein [Porphyromonas somerae]|nr:hypothetical protein [Porphyromonas somerae]MDY3120439.1 hypothetical protein [Porphyromonas somerae]